MAKIVNGKIVGMDESFDTHIGRLALKNLEIFKSQLNQIDLVDGSSETNESFRLRSIRVAQEMETRNLKLGDTVVVVGANHNDLTVPVLAALYKGYKTMLLFSSFSEREFKHFLGLSEPKIIFSDPDVAEILEKVCVSLKFDFEIVVFGDCLETPPRFTNFSSFLRPTGRENNFKAEDFDPKETLALLICSSGTTGLPKCVTMSHHTLISALTFQSAEMKNTLKLTTSQDNKCFVSFSPLYWISGVMSFLSSSVTGSPRLQASQPFSVELFAKAINTYKPASVILIATMLNEILTSPLFDKIDFSCIRLCICSGAPLPEPSYLKMKEKNQYGYVINVYGSTEMAGTVTCDVEHKEKSIGRIISYMKWKLIDITSGEEIKSVGVNGELCLKSDTGLKAYYKNPEKTAECFTNDNYYRTGDVAYFDNDGFIYIIDRIKEVIKYKDYQVAPAEIEGLIHIMPGVLYCCVIGIPNPVDYEHPAAVVQLLEKSKVTENDINKIIEANFSDSRKLRGGVIFLNQMPITATGKIDRRRVKEIVFQMKNVQLIY